MPIQKLTETVADFHLSIEKMAAELQPGIAERLGELLDNPAQLVDELVDQFLEDAEAVSLAGQGFWDLVFELIYTPWDELHATPTDERNDAWVTARGLLLAIAQRQAMIESGLFSRAMIAGVGFSEDLGGALSGVKRKDLADAENRLDIKGSMKARRS